MSIIDRGIEALDANGDGKIEALEAAGVVAGAVAGRVKETAEAAVVAADEVKKGFDADGDGKVSLDEVKVVAEGVGQKVSGVMNNLVDKAAGK